MGCGLCELCVCCVLYMCVVWCVLYVVCVACLLCVLCFCEVKVVTLSGTARWYAGCVVCDWAGWVVPSAVCVLCIV